MSHWFLRGDKIVAWVSSANEYTVIATVTNERAVRQLLRYAQLGEECESIADHHYYEPGENTAIELYEAVSKTIEDTSTTQKVKCPELYEKHDGIP